MSLPPHSQPIAIRSSCLQLFALSFVALFLELMVIRWSPSVVRLIAYYANLMLISSFLGLGIGAILSSRTSRGQGLWLFPLVVALEIAVLYFARRVFLPTSAAEERFAEVPPRIVNYLVLTVIFVSNALTFVPLGKGIGGLFSALPPLRAYAWDLSGSLAGTVAFGLFSFTHFSPVLGMAAVMLIYLLISPWRRWLWAAPLLGCVLWVMHQSNDPAAVWSPYYYITIRPVTNQAHEVGVFPVVRAPTPNLRSMTDPTVYSASVNHDLYQHHGTIDLRRYTPGTAQWNLVYSLARQYALPYELAARHDRVAVMGAGGGMDVEAALLHGARHVDAVEIDRKLVELSRRFNASGVYDDPRVAVHINDARVFLRNTRGKRSYDVVVFGYLDSQALFSYMTNLRLDGYIYTVQSLRSAWELLSDDGMLSLSFAVQQQWLAEKLIKMTGDATGRTPIVYADRGQMILLVPKGRYNTPPGIFHGLARMPLDEWELKTIDVPLATDDWPYLYLARRTIPQDYLIVIGLLLVVSLVAVFALRGRSFQAADWHFLFMGLGFLLLETKSIADCSLYFGTTWAVTTIVVAGVLLMVLAANLIAIRLLRFTFLHYAALFVCLVLLLLVPRDWVLSLGLGARLAWALLVVPLPIFFAGLIFSLTFRDAADPAALLGANLVGAMIGGFCEYLGMATGHWALMWIVIGAYLASYLFVRRLPKISVC